MSAAAARASGLQSEQSDSYRFAMGALLIAAHLALGLSFFGIAPLMPLVIDDYGISRTTASLLVAAPVLLNALIGLPGSVLTSRMGLRRTMTISWFLMSALALSPFASNFGEMLALRLCYGVGAGLMMPSVAPLVMQWFRANEIAIVNTVVLVVMSLGIAVSIALAAPLAEWIRWEDVMGVFGAVALLGAIAWLFFGRERGHERDVAAAFSIPEVLDILRDRTIFLLVVGDALVFIQYAALTSWLPTFFYEFRGMSLEQAGLITGLLPGIGIIAVLVGGYLTFKTKLRRSFFIVPGIMVGLGGLGAFLLRDHLAISISVVILGIGTWIYQPILLTLPM